MTLSIRVVVSFQYDIFCYIYHYFIITIHSNHILQSIRIITKTNKRRIMVEV